MKEEIRRIMALVQEGKLSPEDAAELIDAFAHAEEESEEASTGPQTPPPPPPDAPGADGKDPFKSFVEFMEGLGKEVNEVNWQEIAGHIRKGTQKGIDTLKQTAEQIKQGKVGFGWFGTSETREVKLPLTLGAGKTLRVENRAGDVKVTGGFPEGSVFAKVQVRGSDPEDARKRADEFNLILEESDHLILVRPPEGVGLSVDIVVQLDGAGHVEVVSESGDVRVLDTQAGAKVRTHSGDIQVRGLQGPAELLTQTGDIAVEECTSPAMTVENKAGDISVRKVQGNLSVRAASGDVAIRDCSGKTLSVESVTGDVLVELGEPVTGTLNVRTVNGDARVALPDGNDCRVSVSTLRGDVSCSLDLADEARTDQRITGRLGNGDGTLDISAVNGDISVGLRAAATA